MKDGITSWEEVPLMILTDCNFARGKLLPVTQPVLFSSHDFHWLRQFRPLGDYKESNQVCLFVRLTEAKVAKNRLLYKRLQMV